METKNLSGVLVRNQILQFIEEGKIKFNPPADVLQMQAHSVDLRLGYSFMVPKQWGMTEGGREAFFIDYLDDKERFEIIELEHGQFFDILPKESIIVSSLEEVGLPNDLMAVLFPRSSINRRGLTVDLSGIIDAGYEGRLLIPVTNNTAGQVIRIYPGERFCQLVFHPLTEAIKTRKSRWHKKDIIVGRQSERLKIEENLIVRGKIKDLKSKYGIKGPENK